MPHVIEVEGLTKQYGETRAVQGISFTVEKGEIFGIVGPNGSGKTTTIEILEGLRKRDSGRVHVLGYDPGKESDRYQLNKKIGVQFQDTSIQELMKVKEALNLFASFYDTHGLVDIIEQLHLQDKLNSYFKNLSGGWKQRVTLALSVLHQPEIVFLDEPSMGLDPQARRELWEVIHTLKEQGTTILVTTHYMEEAEKLCDRIAMVYDGRIRALGKPNELLEDLATNYLAFESFDVDPDVLISLPSVIHVEKTREQVRIRTENLQRSAYLVLKECEERDWKVTAFRFERGTLDDLFVHLLKERSV
ncbi:ABC transporter ATP-binding protein [Lederbergia sp. NSJ-179]|uniref:ABC transporter ATP-binding protein n=1 Tax=Lederbergia sp. NSJ-179 TaxID=2931402 RepID=UPI001FD13D7C|nr:ABC transporter ATP-binding protein [Lederbergia sp. NSJ-179]MCJ7842217.1 ABC transporter ATP-binding protein [Lederbergia sp. NSJ-179]